MFEEDRIQTMSLQTYRQILFACLFNLLLVGSACATDKLRIGWVYAMANAPLLVAEQQDYFAQQGLAVELVKFNSGPLLQHALAQGKLDMAYVGTPPVYRWYTQGMRLRILAKVNYGQAALVIPKNSAIQSIRQLKNKKIAGVRYSSGMDILLRGYLLSELAQLDAAHDVDMLHMQVRMMPGAIDRGIVDAAFIWEPFLSLSLLSGKGQVLLDVNDVMARYPWYVVVVTEKSLSNNRQAILKALRAHVQAIDYMNGSTTAGNDIIVDAFKLQSLVEYEKINHSAAEIVLEARKRLGWSYRINQMDIAFVQKLIEHSYRLGFIQRVVDANEIIDTRLLQQILTDISPAGSVH